VKLASDNRRIFSDFSRRNLNDMAEPPKESVHSVLPQKPDSTPVNPAGRSLPPSSIGTDPRTESPELPLRRPPASPLGVGGSRILPPLPRPTGPPLSLSEPVASLLAAAASDNFPDRPGPRKETTRLPSPSARMTMPSARVLAATSNRFEAFDSIPRWFCWSLLGISALIFLIQIWNYTLS
jgi:hypothetical protein